MDVEYTVSANSPNPSARPMLNGYAPNGTPKMNGSVHSIGSNVNNIHHATSMESGITHKSSYHSYGPIPVQFLHGQQKISNVNFAPSYHNNTLTDGSDKYRTHHENGGALLSEQFYYNPRLSDAARRYFDKSRGHRLRRPDEFTESESSVVAIGSRGRPVGAEFNHAHVDLYKPMCGRQYSTPENTYRAFPMVDPISGAQPDDSSHYLANEHFNRTIKDFKTFSPAHSPRKHRSNPGLNSLPSGDNQSDYRKYCTLPRKLDNRITNAPQFDEGDNQACGGYVKYSIDDSVVNSFSNNTSVLDFNAQKQQSEKPVHLRKKRSRGDVTKRWSKNSDHSQLGGKRRSGEYSERKPKRESERPYRKNQLSLLNGQLSCAKPKRPVESNQAYTKKLHVSSPEHAKSGTSEYERLANQALENIECYSTTSSSGCEADMLDSSFLNDSLQSKRDSLDHTETSV